MENIKITSGIFRGQVIKSPKSHLTHPMGSREKLALFNMISGSIPGAKILDAFAGSGALGIEAISRGAKEVVFIEKNPKIASVIRENCQKLGISSNIVIKDIRDYSSDKKYDIIIADPPHDKFDINQVLHLTKYLENGGKLVLSHPAPTPVIDGLFLTKSHSYAKANISIYQK